MSRTELLENRLDEIAEALRDNDKLDRIAEALEDISTRMLLEESDRRRTVSALERISRALEQQNQPPVEYASRWVKLDPKTGKPFAETTQ